MKTRRRELKKRLIIGWQWALWGYIVSQVFVLVYCYNVEPTVFIYGDPFTPVKVKTWFGEKIIYPKYSEYPLIYKKINNFAWVGFWILFLTVVPNSFINEYPKIKKFHNWISKKIEDGENNE